MDGTEHAERKHSNSSERMLEGSLFTAQSVRGSGPRHLGPGPFFFESKLRGPCEGRGFSPPRVPSPGGEMKAKLETAAVLAGAFVLSGAYVAFLAFLKLLS